MAENLYVTYNAAMPTTGLPTKQTTGAAANALLQIQLPSTTQFSIVEWGISFDGSPSAIQVNLVQTNAGATMSTATVASGLMPFTNPGAPASQAVIGATTNTGFSTAAVTPTGTTVVVFDSQILSTNTYIKQWPLAREPQIAVSTFIQVRCLAAVAVNCTTYVVWRE